jgi:hypothetical protein
MRGPLNVIYIDADKVSLSARACRGRLSIDATTLAISGDPGVSLPLASLREVHLHRSQLGHVVRVRHQGGSLLLAVYRVNLWGYFVILNYFANRRLAEQLRELLASSAA